MVLIKIKKYINMESLNITHDEERWMFIFSRQGIYLINNNIRTILQGVILWQNRWTNINGMN